MGLESDFFVSVSILPGQTLEAPTGEASPVMVIVQRAFEAVQQWYFGMKAHMEVDNKAKIIHSVVATAANVADSQILPDLLHGDETRV